MNQSLSQTITTIAAITALAGCGFDPADLKFGRCDGVCAEHMHDGGDAGAPTGDTHDVAHGDMDSFGDADILLPGDATIAGDSMVLGGDVYFAGGDPMVPGGDAYFAGGDSASCADGVKNGDESGVDCGGACVVPCDVGAVCNRADDCTARVCRKNTCRASDCWNDELDGDELGVDCGGGCRFACDVCQAQPNIPVSECQALHVLYDDTDGAGWIDSGDWLVTLSPCSWFGVYCSGGGVIELNLLANDLLGDLPPELQYLTRLQKLDLRGTWAGTRKLTGGIPRELANLSSLKTLSLFYNELSGPIPVALHRLVDLTVLRLDSNRLTGSIPPELGVLTALSSLQLNRNMLDGPIPPELGNLIELTYLALSTNNLTGAVPPELGSLTALTHMFLTANNLSGAIPESFGNLAQLMWLDVSGNGLTGSIPTTLGALSNLKNLLIQSNQLTGTIPAELGDLAALQQLNLSGNMLTGTVPQSLQNLTALNILGLATNELSGVAPGVLGALSVVKQIQLAHNQLDQAAVDAIIDQIYTAKWNYTQSFPMMNIGGTNAAPSGNVTDPTATPGNGASNTDWNYDTSSNCHLPLTAAAQIYTLINDPCGEQFVPWDITYGP